jgi:hypothetical protein
VARGRPLQADMLPRAANTIHYWMHLRDGFSFFDPFFALFDQICSKTGFFGHICSVLIKFVQTGFC